MSKQYCLKICSAHIVTKINVWLLIPSVRPQTPNKTHIEDQQQHASLFRAIEDLKRFVYSTPYGPRSLAVSRMLRSRREMLYVHPASRLLSWYHRALAA